MKKEKYKGYLVGNKIGKSYSKDIYPNFLNVSYKQLEFKDSKDLIDFIKTKDYDFINVTIPYKSDVINSLDEADQGVIENNSCNLIINDDGVLKGYNTDIFGLYCLFKFNDIDFNNKNVLILGNGATSRNIKYTLLNYAFNPKRIDVACRHKKSEKEMFFSEVKDEYEILINATPVGKNTYDSTLVDINSLTKLETIIDVNYNLFRTKFLVCAKDKGIGHINGLDMLLLQAAKAIEILTGEEIDFNKLQRVKLNLRFKYTNVYLIGLPTSGKTKVYNDLKNMFGKDCGFLIDTDELIESTNKKTISKIFEDDGELGLRQEEFLLVEMLKKLQGGRIISTGGGFFTENKANYYTLVRKGLFIYIKKSNFDDFKDDNKRPLVHSKEDLIKLYKKRHKEYDRMADVTVESGIKAEDLVEVITDALISC